MRTCLSAITLVLLCVFTCRAQPLADRMPAGTILYVGWSGSDSLGPGFDGSHFKAVLDASGMHELMTDFLPAVAAKVAESDRQAAQMLPLITSIITPVWKYPTALYFGGIGMDQGGPMPKLAVLIDAEQQADAVMQGLANPLAMAAQSGAPITSKVVNGVVVISVGPIPAELQTTLEHPGAASLVQDDAFKTTMAQLTPQPVAAYYLSVTKLIAAADQAIGAMAPAIAPAWNQIKTNLALDGIKASALTAGFDGKDWGMSAVLWAPAPRTGLAEKLQTPPLNDDIFKLVPRSATFMSVMQLNLGKLIENLRDLAQLKPEIAQQVDQAIQQANAMLGFDIQKDFINVLGSGWTVFTNPDVAGNGVVATVLVNHLADAARMEQSLIKIEQLANMMIARNMHEPSVHITFETKEIAGTTLHYLAAPLVTPTWAIRDGNLYVGAYPQPVLDAATFGNSKGPSILENEKYQAVRKHLGPTAVTASTFFDLPAWVPENYGPWTAISRLVGYGDVFGIKSPLLLMPPLKSVMENIAPAGEVTWTDDFGFHYRAVTPFPGSELLASNPASGMGAMTPMLVSIMLPALSQARDVANRAKSASNLKQIAQGCMLYANENNGRLPDNLGELLKKEDMVPGVLLSPLSGHVMPPGLPGDQFAKWASDHSDYVYLGAGKNMRDMTAEKVLAHEKMDIAQREHGMNIVFGDGHVEWMSLPQAERLIQGTSR